jgi:hypothetical protein
MVQDSAFHPNTDVFLGDLRDSSRRSVSCPARVKALDPMTSTTPPSRARVIEYSDHGIKLEAANYFMRGTLLQLHVERNFSLWKVRYCVAQGLVFHVGLELAVVVHPLAA